MTASNHIYPAPVRILVLGGIIQCSQGDAVVAMRQAMAARELLDRWPEEDPNKWCAPKGDQHWKRRRRDGRTDGLLEAKRYSMEWKLRNSWRTREWWNNMTSDERMDHGAKIAASKRRQRDAQ